MVNNTNETRFVYFILIILRTSVLNILYNNKQEFFLSLCHVRGLLFPQFTEFPSKEFFMTDFSEGSI